MRSPVVFKLFIIFILTIVFNAAYMTNSYANTNRFLITGDSITHGRGGDYTWRYFFYKSLVADKIPVDFVGPHTGLSPHGNGTYADPKFDQHHEALWGRMAFDAQRSWDVRMNFWFDLRADILNYKPTVIINMLGYNDFWLLASNNDPRGSAQFVFDNQKFIIERARAVDPNIDFIIGKMGHQWSFGTASTIYNQMLTTLQSTPTSKIVLAEPALTNRNLTYDGAHPTKAGERAIAESVRSAAKALGFNAPPKPPLPAPKKPTVNRTLSKTHASVRWTPKSGERYIMHVKNNGVWSSRAVSGGSFRFTLGKKPKSVRIQAKNKTGMSPRSAAVFIPKR